MKKIETQINSVTWVDDIKSAIKVIKYMAFACIVIWQMVTVYATASAGKEILFTLQNKDKVQLLQKNVDRQVSQSLIDSFNSIGIEKVN